MNKYSIILADPPWEFRTRSEKGKGRSPDRHYPTMSTEAICALGVAGIAASNSLLFLWATYPRLPDALQVISAWGFIYKSVAFTWVKLNPSGVGFHLGAGYWTRQNPELCLLATRGNPKRVNKGVRNLIVSPRGRHSEKPPEIRDHIVQLIGDLPRIELFARQRVSGWSIWGNEAPGGSDIELHTLRVGDNDGLL